jgi:hypothetical protein
MTELQTYAPTHFKTHDHEHAAARRRRSSSATRHFIRHYVEMVVAMFLGMAVLGLPAGWALGAAGSSWSELNTDAPALMLLGMAATMTIPMVAWMRYRGHGWRPNTEMAASMILPTFASVGLLAARAMDIDALLAIEHVAMLLAMLAAMLLRRDEYTHHHARAAGPELASA